MLSRRAAIHRYAESMDYQPTNSSTRYTAHNAPH
jgi:hypothetical protein